MSSGKVIPVAAMVLHGQLTPPEDRTGLNRHQCQVQSTGKTMYTIRIVYTIWLRKTVRHSEKCAGLGCWKKQMPCCNGVDKGSRFALLRKQADVLCRCLIAETLSELSSCRNRYGTLRKAEWALAGWETMITFDAVGKGFGYICIFEIGNSFTGILLRCPSRVKGNFHARFLGRE